MEVRRYEKAHSIEKVYDQKRFHSALSLRPLDEYEEILRGENREEQRRELLSLCVQP